MTGARAAEWRLLAHVKNGCAQECEVMLNAGLDANCTDEYGITLLIWASRKGHVDVIRALVSHGADLNRADCRGRTALHHAVALNKPNALKALISAGINLDKKDSDGNTALELATLDDNHETARFLLDAGASGMPPDHGDLSIGCVCGGPKETPFSRVLSRLWDRIVTGRNPNPWTTRGHLNVVFDIAGTLHPPDFEGVIAGPFSRRRRTMMVRVAVPDSSLSGQKAEDFILSALRSALAVATARFRKAKITFAADEVTMLINSLGP
jgi:hypothetical protein